MLTRSSAVVLLVLAGATPLAAELKYTTHLEVKKVDTPATAPANPILTLMGDTLAKQLLPEGPTDMISIVGEKGVRMETTKPMMGQPAGAITLWLPDGTVAVLNPKEQTYWKTASDVITGTIQSSGLKPQATAKRTGQFDTVAGVTCERVQIDVRIDLPIPEAARSSLPPGFPTSLSMDGENCVTTDQYAKYVDMATKARGASDLMAAMGLDKLVQGGIVLRQIVRLSGMQLESVVTAISEEDAPATLFTIPADYKEVPAPQIK